MARKVKLAAAPIRAIEAEILRSQQSCDRYSQLTHFLLAVRLKGLSLFLFYFPAVIFDQNKFSKLLP